MGELTLSRVRGLLAIWPAALVTLAAACSSTPGPAAAPPDAAGTPTAAASPTAISVEPDTEAETALPEFMRYGWETDFSRHTVPYEEIRPGGPARDGIPPIDDPAFISASTPPAYMSDDEPVISLEIAGDRRAYPLAIMVKHEIVNDVVGGRSVTVTYCPLCNTGIAFERTLDGRLLDFGTTGNLRNSNLIMWDRQTQTWWQQATGEAIVGELSGAILTFIPVQIVSWKAFRDAFPNGLVLSRDTGFEFVYDSPPYGGYDVLLPRDSSTDLFGEHRIQPRDRVVSLSVAGKSVAYPFSLLEEHPVINDAIDGLDVVIFFVGGALSPFPEQVDETISSGLSSMMLYEDVSERGDLSFRTVGATAVFSPTVDGAALTFEVRAGDIVDRETGSRWDILGRAVGGPLKGATLEPVVHGNDFWFAWVAFHPDTEVRTIGDVLR